MSPYSGYNGQMRSSVYQPTELAIITKGVTNVGSSMYQFCVAYVNSCATLSLVTLKVKLERNLQKSCYKTFNIWFMYSTSFSHTCFLLLHICGFSSRWTIRMILRSHEPLSSPNRVKAATSALPCLTLDGSLSLTYAALWSYLVFPLSLYCALLSYNLLTRVITFGASPLIYQTLTSFLFTLLLVRKSCFPASEF